MGSRDGQENGKTGPGAVNATLQPARLTVEEIAARLGIGRISVYALLERGIIPAVRLGKRWIVTRQAYERWEATCGAGPSQAGSPTPFRVA